MYPLPISLRTIYRPYIGFRTVAGDAREQATNFTHCPDFWNIYKVEAAVYPTDDVFNMCRDEAFYRQDPDESIDCAYTEKVGYSVITIGATLIVTMYIVAYLIIFIEKVKNIEIALSSKIRDEFKITACTTRGFFLSIKVALTTVVSLSMPKMNNWQVLVKDSILFLIAPAVEALDIMLEGAYVVRLARILNRFLIKASTIRLMLNLYTVAVFKDITQHFILICIFFVDHFHCSNRLNSK